MLQGRELHEHLASLQSLEDRIGGQPIVLEQEHRLGDYDLACKERLGGPVEPVPSPSMILVRLVEEGDQRFNVADEANAGHSP